MAEGFSAWVSVSEVVAPLVEALWPKRFRNVAVRFTIKAIGLGFRCDDMSMGKFRVWVFDKSLEDVVYMEGKNNPKTVPTIGFNFMTLDAPVLKDIFHMARCRRELERAGDIEIAQKYEEYRNAVVSALGDK
jgi:hypothetical protein